MDWRARVRDTAKRAEDAARQGASQAKDRGQQLSLRRRQSALAAELGQIVFRQREGEGGLDAEVDRLVGEMRATRDEIEALETP